MARGNQKLKMELRLLISCLQNKIIPVYMGEPRVNACLLSFSVMSNYLQPRGLYPATLLCPWGFSRQEYWNGLHCPPPGDLPNPGIKPRSPALQVDSLPSEPPEKPKNTRGGSLTFFQKIFLIQEPNQCLLHCGWILYQLSYLGNPESYRSPLSVEDGDRRDSVRAMGLQKGLTGFPGFEGRKWLWAKKGRQCLEAGKDKQILP